MTMSYGGRYQAFDTRRVRAYPVAGRPNKVTLDSLVGPDDAMKADSRLSDALAQRIDDVADAIVEARRQDRAVICFTGAHLIKNGMGPLLADLIERGAFTLVAGNGATAIHDFELALMGETSENVPAALLILSRAWIYRTPLQVLCFIVLCCIAVAGHYASPSLWCWDSGPGC